MIQFVQQLGAASTSKRLTEKIRTTEYEKRKSELNGINQEGKWI